MPTIIAIANQKGGVAKTTTCLNLSHALSERDRRVLLIDIDPQASLTISLWVPNRAIPSTDGVVRPMKSALSPLPDVRRIAGQITVAVRPIPTNPPRTLRMA
jgi:cellulose biosynthesis protein BcsQ